MASWQHLKAQNQKKPNIVFILADNLGWGELGVYGGGILRGAPTPRIDHFASEGLRLLNFNVETECVPTRTALMTGRHAIRTGTFKSPAPGQPNGLVQWGITIAEPLARYLRILARYISHCPEGSLRVPFIIRWTGKIKPNSVSDELVHIVDMFTTLAHFGGTEIPKDRAIDGVDAGDFYWVSSRSPIVKDSWLT